MHRFVGRALTLALLTCAVLTTARTAAGANQDANEHANPSRLAAWVELGADGEIIARAITPDVECPFIKLDSTRHRMSLRAAAETVPQRPTTSPPDQSKPSEFPVTTCEYSIPRRTRVAAVHFFADDDAIQPSPFGGFFWDGRADSIVDLVKEPLLDADEMNNRDLSQIAQKISAAPYAADFRREFGDGRGDPQAAVTALGRAVEAFLTSDEMAPFSSKYDAYIRGKVKLTALEARGLKLFKDPDKGNCASCHRFYDSSSNPERSLFTDFGYDAVAVPRNAKIAANADPQRFDLGLCERRDERTPSNDETWCVSFRTPSLRNVAVRQTFMHNGVFKSLRDAVAFYATRATDPMRWYRSGVKFDDVPPKYRHQVNVNSIPYNRRQGDTPALTDAEVDAIVAFLGTLTDAAYRNPAH